MRVINVPHPIPYQGSKRFLAHTILSLFPSERVRLFEPFAGSAAISLAAIANGLATHIVLNDANKPLMQLWERIIETPHDLISTYMHLWNSQLGNERAYYDQIRADFNQNHTPDLLLYLLARCVKASIRYNSNGEFNQSPDNRRRGTRPETIAKHVLAASKLFYGRTTVRKGDFQKAISDATATDVIYMDPPYQGVCGKRDNRYCEGLPFDHFVEILDTMIQKKLSFIVSYDGHTGGKQHGARLPDRLGLKHVQVKAGVSSQATLLGRSVETIESLYISPALTQRTRSSIRIESAKSCVQTQLALF